ncbi:MAG: hypothetical protein ICV67_00080 [Thermoleophilia bacterium]|nr:hypothetical protein [Thermoleophilia bacterium]
MGEPRRQSRNERQAANEAVFREVNERRAALNRQADAPQSEVFEFVCECGVAGACTGRIEMTLGEYDVIRRQDDRFAVLAGHEHPDVERVVERHERYVVVDKLPEVEEFVEDDPRGAPSR